MKKVALILLIFVLGVTLLPGCTIVSSRVSNQDKDPVITEPQVVETPKDQAGAGNFIGRVDNNSVEIVVDGVARVFISTEVERDIGFLKKNEPVEIVYYENENKQLVLKHIYIMD